MRVLIFGASGMIGGGALLECLEDEGVESVTCVVRRSLGMTHPKLTEVIHGDLFDLAPLADRLGGFDTCFYTLGVTSAGMSEDDYRRITVELTRAILDVVVAASPDVTVCFVSGQGTDASGQGRVMWARVKGEAEAYVRTLPVRSYLFRPGFIQPLKGVRSRTTLYQVLYVFLRPLTPLLRALFPNAVTTTVEVGRAMIRAARERPDDEVLEQARIIELGRV